jgi:hypothetical protein
VRATIGCRRARLSEVYGIAIYMYFSDHDPPHFHAIYAEHEALVRIDNGLVIVASCPRSPGSWSSGGDDFTSTSSRRTGRPRQEPNALSSIDPLP